MSSLVVPGLTRVSLGMVNAYLVHDKESVVIVDSGLKVHGPRILRAVRRLGRQPEDVQLIIATHAHIDHTGSLAFLKRSTGAPVAMHPADAELLASGATIRPWTPGRDRLSRFICALSPPAGRARVEPVLPDTLLTDGAQIDLTGGLRVHHAPGHSAGQIVLLWRESVLIGADIVTNWGHLRPPVLFEEESLAYDTIRRIALLPFETAVFGHGRPIVGAAKRVIADWAESLPD